MAAPATTVVNGELYDSLGNAIEGAEVEWSHGGFFHGVGWVAGEARSVFTNASGAWTITVAETQSIGRAPYTVTIRHESEEVYDRVGVPTAGPVNFSAIAPEPIENPDESGEDDRVAVEANLVMERGSAFRPAFNLKVGGVTEVLTGKVARMHVRLQPHSSWTLYTWSTGGGEIVLSGTDPNIQLEVDETVTASALAGGYYDLEIDDWPVAGKTTRVAEGIVTLKSEITQ